MQIIDYLVQQINNKELKDGDKFPTEEVLCAYFNVSRITVRNALNEFENQGYIIKRHGKPIDTSMNTELSRKLLKIKFRNA